MPNNLNHTVSMTEVDTKTFIYPNNKPVIAYYWDNELDS